MAKYKNTITHWEERQMIRRLVEKYSRDETIVALNSKLKALELENGMLKSELSEIKDTMKNKINQMAKQINRQELIEIEQKCRDLEWQLMANNIQLNKKYL